jgi:hypothetical protein
MKTLIKIEIKLVRWDPNKKPPGGNIFLINRGLNPLFHHPVLLLILNCHNQELNPIVTQPQAKPFFLVGGVLVLGRRD